MIYGLKILMELVQLSTIRHMSTEVSTHSVKQDQIPIVALSLPKHHASSKWQAMTKQCRILMNIQT